MSSSDRRDNAPGTQREPAPAASPTSGADAYANWLDRMQRARARQAAITRNLRRSLTAILQLPAIGEHEPRRRIAAPCPYCGTPALIAAPRSGRITCADPDCEDTTGRHPVGTVEIGTLSGPLIAWADGLIMNTLVTA